MFKALLDTMDENNLGWDIIALLARAEQRLARQYQGFGFGERNILISVPFMNDTETQFLG